MKEQLQQILNEFNIQGTIEEYNVLTNGNINSTIKIIVCDNNEKKILILQKINTNVFKNPKEVMQNIFYVTSHIKQKLINDIDKERKVLNFYKTKNNEYFLKIQDNYFRLCDFVKDSITFNLTDDNKILQETGKAFGEFQLLLDDFKIENLYITIKDFHNTENRYLLFEEAIKQNAKNRVCEVTEEIKEYRFHKQTAILMCQMLNKNMLPLRVTHNDTKCNNVMFDKNTFERLCVIDLDTIMPGLVGFDFGDAIRFCANTTTEDEKDISKINFDLEKFEAFTKGFLNQTGKKLTPKEIETLPLGAITMTLENGLRFLTDYINGDTYFKINYPTHNLDRARCQLILAKKMIVNYEKMQLIIKKYV